MQYESAARIIKLIPPTASVSATRYMMPLTSNREEVHNYNLGRKTDYLLVQRQSLTKRMRPRFEADLKSPKFEEVTNGEGIFLLKRVTDEKARD